MKKVLVLLIMVVSLNSCGEGCDCCLGDPCWDAQFDNVGLVGGSIELTEEESECIINTSTIQSEYNDKISEARDLANLDLEALAQDYPEDFFENYNLYINDLKVAFESEGGNLTTLEEKLFALGEEIGAKISAIPVSIDIDSQEWRDTARPLDLELVEGIVALFSEGGVETEALAIEFFEWYKINKKDMDENEDNVYAIGNMLNLEIERLSNEQAAAIEALNCA